MSIPDPLQQQAPLILMNYLTTVMIANDAVYSTHATPQPISANDAVFNAEQTLPCGCVRQAMQDGPISLTGAAWQARGATVKHRVLCKHEIANYLNGYKV